MSTSIPRAGYAGPLRIGAAEIDAYVVEIGGEPVRILSTRSVMKSLGRTWRGRKHTGGTLPVFLEAKNLRPFIDEELEVLLQPIKFRTDRGILSDGYSALALPKICYVFLDAKSRKALTGSQEPIAARCELLVRGFATVGIVALVDEATGYQEDRDRRALEKILERWIAKELRAWAKRFPDEFYVQMFRLKGWPSPLSVRRPQVVGRYTNDVVYERLEAGVLDELRSRNPVDSTTRRRKTRHHQWLTEDVGHPKLRDHLSGVIALMRVARDWPTFKRLLNRAYPKKGQPLELPLEDLEP
jgi:hypothetical protein